jgi:hypothetical protein
MLQLAIHLGNVHNKPLPCRPSHSRQCSGGLQRPPLTYHIEQGQIVALPPPHSVNPQASNHCYWWEATTRWLSQPWRIGNKHMSLGSCNREKMVADMSLGSCNREKLVADMCDQPLWHRCTCTVANQWRNPADCHRKGFRNHANMLFTRQERHTLMILFEFLSFLLVISRSKEVF